MRHLIVCCDGTWNTPEDQSITNVRRLYNALEGQDHDGNVQLSYYQPGVGTLRHRLLGGAFGLGLSENVMEVYQWLTTNYEKGDLIWLFGFSRGAYTARSAAGMISACGLVGLSRMDQETVSEQVRDLYDQYRKRRKPDRRRRSGLSFRWDPEDREQIPIHFVGVWDTVGALGIPAYMGWLSLLDPLHRYDFHDLRLNPYIKRARHAVAMDERRGPYTPTLWSEPFAARQDVEQVWFPGVHKDVGGGHLEAGLSDGALLWMIEQAQTNEAGLAFRQETVDQIRPNPLDLLHDHDRGVIGVADPLLSPTLKPLLEVFLQPRPRAVPRIDPSRRMPDMLHASVYDRHWTVPITSGPYRPTTVLAPGDTAKVEIYAHDPWNETGLYLEAGEYHLSAGGQWMDGNIPSGPAGTQGLRLLNPLVEKARLAGTLLGLFQQVFRFATGNKLADFIGARREEDLPWMSLVGVVANNAVQVKGEPNAHERIAIGSGTRCTVTKGGYLYAYANDAWGFYGNNRGSVRLTVSMISAETDRSPAMGGQSSFTR